MFLTSTAKGWKGKDSNADNHISALPDFLGKVLDWDSARGQDLIFSFA